MTLNVTSEGNRTHRINPPKKPEVNIKVVHTPNEMYPSVNTDIVKRKARVITNIFFLMSQCFNKAPLV